MAVGDDIDHSDIDLSHSLIHIEVLMIGRSSFNRLSALSEPTGAYQKEWNFYKMLFMLTEPLLFDHYFSLASLPLFLVHGWLVYVSHDSVRNKCQLTE